MRLALLLMCVVVALPVFYATLSDPPPQDNATTVAESEPTKPAETEPPAVVAPQTITPQQIDSPVADKDTAAPEVAVTVANRPVISAAGEVAPKAASPATTVANTAPAAEATGPQIATHKEASVIKMLHADQKVQLHTFTTDSHGNILACVSAPAGDTSEVELADGSTASTAGYLQTYGHDGTLLRETPLSFRPTAVNATQQGTIIVAGHGKVARISADGALLTLIPSPHLGDPANSKELEERIAADAAKQQAGSLDRYQRMVTQVADRIKAIEDKPEADRTSRDKLLLKSLPKQKELYEQQLSMMKQMLVRGSSSSASMLTRKMGITALAVTSRDVFLCCYAVEGRGYEVWRTTHELTEPTKIMTGLGGCCGQCDIQAAGDNIAIAENTKFKVAIVDRDGERLSDFGSRDRASVDGFGSCCNPMNVRCCSNGDILTGESSVGNIKRFSADGDYLGLIGKARIGGGCKHVALAHDEQRNRYYMMNIDQDHICVLVPLSEAPAMTEQELLAQKAVDAHGQKFYGTWAIDTPEDDEPAPQTRSIQVVRIVDGKRVTETREVPISSTSSRRYLATEYTFHSDGRLEMKGSSYASSNCRWEALEHDETSIKLGLIRDEVHSYDFLIEFADNDNAGKISMLYKTSVRGAGDFKRTCCEDGCEKPESKGGSAESVIPVTAR